MIKLTNKAVVLDKSANVLTGTADPKLRCNTMAYRIMEKHNTSGNLEQLKIRFDALVSPDNNYVSILQTAAASGVKEFPIPYVLSNCHNTLCAVGGTINEDDHVFGLDNVKKYGGIFVPPYKAVLHQYMREMMAGGGKMILGSDSHTRYGVLGTLAIGEGGGEIAKQLLSQTYDIACPPIIAVKLTGRPRRGVGPQDVALTLIGATFDNKFTQNKILEFVGPGISNLSVEYRMGIDVMTTESAALSSIWESDDEVQEYLKTHGRKADYKAMKVTEYAYYEGMIEIDLSKVECMMALPYHPSNVCTIHEFQKDPKKYLQPIEERGNQMKRGADRPFDLIGKVDEKGLHIDQAMVSGCSGGLFENIAAMADILRDAVVEGGTPALGINPASQPIFAELTRHGIVNELIDSGATMRPCICGPCFGVTDVPADNQISIRHVTRNYPSREGAKPNNGQMAAAILMDARSIAATIRGGGVITAASDLNVEYHTYNYHYNPNYYTRQVLNRYRQADPSAVIRKGPNIEDWPAFEPVKKHLLLQAVGVYDGAVTTDDLSPSGDAVAYRSNPLKLAEFTMINKDKGYVERAKNALAGSKLKETAEQLAKTLGCDPNDIGIGSIMAARQIGDGSSREQAASSQKILGGQADIAAEFVTKRYRSNLINWGMLPILSDQYDKIQIGDMILIEQVDQVIAKAGEPFAIKILGDADEVMTGNIGTMTYEEKEILSSGCLINYNKNKGE
ncbi:MAG: hydratase [Lachnospiraceae bacterium]